MHDFTKKIFCLDIILEVSIEEKSKNVCKQHINENEIIW